MYRFTNIYKLSGMCIFHNSKFKISKTFVFLIRNWQWGESNSTRLENIQSSQSSLTCRLVSMRPYQFWKLDRSTLLAFILRQPRRPNIAYMSLIMQVRLIMFLTTLNLFFLAGGGNFLGNISLEVCYTPLKIVENLLWTYK